MNIYLFGGVCACGGRGSGAAFASQFSPLFSFPSTLCLAVVTILSSKAVKRRAEPSSVGLLALWKNG